MRDFKGKTAVITGAASGFGLAFARECARREMKVVMNDIDGENLARAAEDVRALGAEVTALEGDASLYADVQKLVKLAAERHGSLDLLFNNAGIYALGRVWEQPARDVQWMMDVNVMGVFYGMREVIPVMLAQGTPCHIVNVASVAGLFSTRSMAAYHASKAAAVAASEATLMDLRAMPDCNIGISVFCPGYIHTNLDESERHRPARYAQGDDPYYQSAAYKKNATLVHRFIQGGEDVSVVAPAVFRGIEEGVFYLSTEATDAVSTPLMQKRFDNILRKTNPV